MSAASLQRVHLDEALWSLCCSKICECPRKHSPINSYNYMANCPHDSLSWPCTFFLRQMMMKLLEILSINRSSPQIVQKLYRNVTFQTPLYLLIPMLPHLDKWLLQYSEVLCKITSEVHKSLLSLCFAWLSQINPKLNYLCEKPNQDNSKCIFDNPINPPCHFWVAVLPAHYRNSSRQSLITTHKRFRFRLQLTKGFVKKSPQILLWFCPIHPVLFSDDIWFCFNSFSRASSSCITGDINSDWSLWLVHYFFLWLLLVPYLCKDTSHKFPFWKLDPPHDCRLSSVTSDYVSSEDLRALSSIKTSLRWY